MAEPQRPNDSALLLDAALESIPYGFCVWSSAFRLVMWNRHYLDLYGFPPSRITAGMTLAAVVKLSAELGNHPVLAHDLAHRGLALDAAQQFVVGGSHAVFQRRRCKT